MKWLLTAHILMAEIKEMCRLDNNSFFRDTRSLLHNFSWEVVWAELEAKAPTNVGAMLL